MQIGIMFIPTFETQNHVYSNYEFRIMFIPFKNDVYSQL